MEAQRNHPNCRVDPQAEKIADDGQVRYWLERLNTEGAVPETERSDVLAQLTVIAADEYGVHLSTVVRGLNKAQRERAIAETARGKDGLQA